jgi:hypothetical protein
MMAASSREGFIRSILGNLAWAGGLSLLVQRSATLLLDAQVAQK